MSRPHPYITWCQIRGTPTMALSGLKPPGWLNLQNNMAMNWQAWYDAYEFYAVASGASSKGEKVQCSLFLHVAGPEAQKAYRTMNIPSEDKDKIKPLVKAFKEYCEKKTNITVIRYKFNSYAQTTESMDTYIRELQYRISYCNYGPLEESMLCDRIVCGVKSNKLRNRLLRTPELTLSRCLEMCRLSEFDATQLGGSQTSVEDHVNAVTKGARAPVPARLGAWADRQLTDTSSGGKRIQCTRCGYNHTMGACPAKGKMCAKCKLVGHFSKVCKTKRPNPVPIDEIDLDENNREGEEVEMEDTELFVGTMMTGEEDNRSLWFENVQLGGSSIPFKLDTGSQANIVPRMVYDRLTNVVLRPTKSTLITYSGERIRPDGEFTAWIKGQELRFQVVKNGSAIMGKDGCVALGLVKRVNAISKREQGKTVPVIEVEEPNAQMLVNNYLDIFSGLGKIKSNATIYVDEEVQPVIDPPRRIPHAIKEKVKSEIDRMLRLGVIVEETEPTPWVNSITIVQKPDKIRVCLDPTKLNKAILQSPYPTRTVEEVIAKVANAKYFSVIDANSGYWQIELDNKSSKLCTFNTPWGRYRYTRLPFGIKTAGDIFIQEMNSILYGLSGVNVIADDILVYGSSINEHNERLESVFKRAREVNLKFNPGKCKICKKEVNYVGHTLSEAGVRPTKERVQAILDMPPPTDKAGIQRFLGMVGYIGKFIPNLSDIAQPLRLLLTKNVLWHWQHEQVKAFETLKKLLTTAPVLQFYDVEKPITLQVDASKSGLGAVLFQEGRPVAMASKALDCTQSNYAVIEKELLAICFGCIKFHDYIFGKEVIIQTDHKPLVAILHKPLHTLSARMQRMRMRLQNYNIVIVHIKGSEMYFADALSRAHTADKRPSDLFDTELAVATIGVDPDVLETIRKETSEDDCLIEVKRLSVEGWPIDNDKVNPVAKPFFTYRHDITVSEGILYKGNQIIIPNNLKKKMLDLIHETHLGIVKSKQLARDCLFWPGMNKQLDDKISRCSICQSFRRKQHSEPLISHVIPEQPFEKVGVDIFYMNGKAYLILVDYMSKFPEVAILSATTSSEVIAAMKVIFCRFGIPKTVVSDNGPQFSCQEYRDFATEYGFVAVFSSPHYPRSNGQVERYVQTIKNIMKKAEVERRI